MSAKEFLDKEEEGLSKSTSIWTDEVIKLMESYASERIKEAIKPYREALEGIPHHTLREFAEDVDRIDTYYSRETVDEVSKLLNKLADLSEKAMKGGKG